ncbi:uncharacterized protein LOC107762158 [Nicotiana tabacum]|uniref:Uncharacterized protein LOC107762158 n=1 Tax=Nicotiana tabacum TaxID=4097 RepID=A0A1S3X7I8_TOBAC|nr:PREDICTED: uncharacterized protein LOC107762158 [Nicotiana tabacum]
MVLKKLEGSEYNKLEAYAQKLRETSLGTDVVIQISKDAMEEGKRRFLRMYVCFQALKSGFKVGLRPFIGLDGTFLKGKCKGMLLVAVAQDSCKHVYPLAWAVVDKETKITWQWFMENLKASLDLKDGEGYTFMSDMPKGVLDVVRNVCPQSYHRYCARHIEANWSKKWNTDEMKKLMWWCSWSTYEEEFKDMLKQLGEVSEDAVRDLLNYPPVTWCRAYFDTQCKNPIMDNNFTESFNSWILEARHKPIVKMLEDIRVKVMNQLKDRAEEVNSWRGEYNPYAMELYNDYREMTSKCKENFNVERGFKISEGEDKHTVILEQKRAYLYKKQDSTLGIHWWYSKQAWQLVSQHKLQHVRGERFWKVEPHQAMDPPPLAKMVGKLKSEKVKREG